MKKIFLCLSFSLSSSLLSSGASYAQDTAQDQMMSQIEEFMKHRDEMIKSLFSDEFDQSLESTMQKMMDGFGEGWADLNDHNNWQKTDTHKVLSVKVKQIKDKPLDIKIEKGMIHIKGETQIEFGATKRRSRFEKSYSIPRDVDQNSPEFENKENEILIKFKLLTKSDRVPIGASDGQLSL